MTDGNDLSIKSRLFFNGGLGLERIGKIFPLTRIRFVLIVMILALVLRAVYIPTQMPADFYADSYESRVVLNDIGDMYTKDNTNQTSTESSYWTKEESSPYPPFSLLLLAGIHLISGSNLWLGVVIIELIFIALFAFLCYRNRYERMLPFLTLNPFIVFRVWHQMDTTYMLMVYPIVIAFFMALSRRRVISSSIMALSFCIKLAPVYFFRFFPKLGWKERVVLIAIPLFLLVLPILFLDDYLYIYTFQGGRSVYPLPLMVALMVIFLAVFWWMEFHSSFRFADFITWSLLPFSVLITLKIGYWKYLAWAMFIPDRRFVMNYFGLTMALIWGLLEITLKPIDEVLAPFMVLIVILMCIVILLFQTRWKKGYGAIIARKDRIWSRIVIS